MNVAAAAFLMALIWAPVHTRAPRDTGAARSIAVAQARDTFDVGMLRVDHSGRAGRPPLIFIPALFCGPWQWDRELAALADRYDLYALTLPGFDDRPRDGGGDLMARAVADIALLIERRHLDRPVLIGHSLGGTLAVLFAETHPSAIRAVIAVEGGYPVGPTEAVREQRAAASTAPYVGVERAAFGAALRRNMLQYVVTRPSDVDRLETLASRSDPAAVVDWMRAALSLDLTPGLARLKVPLKEIVPFDADIDPHQGFPSLEAKRAAYRAWVAHAPGGGRIMMVPRSRHFVMIDRPREFDRLLFTAIERVAPR
jgi:pimeloyl-ACP methyl ester carboxylesterase